MAFSDTSRPFKVILLWGTLTGILGVGFCFFPFAVDLEETLGLELLFRMRGAMAPPLEVAIINLDKVSSDRLHISPDPRKWPRSFHALLIEALSRQGAAVIVFDVFFDEAKSIEEDTLLAEVIRKAGNVVLCQSLEMEQVSLHTKEGRAAEDLIIVKVVSPTPILAQAAAALAPFPLPKVPMKVNQYWTFKAGAGDIPTLPVVTFQVYALKVYGEFVRLMVDVHPELNGKFPGSAEEILRDRSVEKTIQEIREAFQNAPWIAEAMLSRLNVGSPPPQEDRTIRLLKSLIRMYSGPKAPSLNFYGPPGTVATVSYHQALERKEGIQPGEKSFDFKGKVVFIGSSGQSLSGQKDGFYTAFSQPDGLDITGVELAATAFSNLVSDRPVRPFRSEVRVLILFLWGMLIGAVMHLLPLPVAAAALVGMSLAYLFLAKQSFSAMATWCPVVLPVLIQSPFAFFGMVVWRYAESNRERRNIRKAFGYFLPSSVVDQLSRNITHLQAGHQVVYGICLSTDAERYTSVSESMGPEELAEYMNRYYETIFKPIKQRSGIVANVIGDSVLALWVASGPDPSLRKAACRAALDIEEAINQFNRSSGSFQLPTRIGLHSGPILLGHLGALDHYEYRPVGDIVNTATRIEGLNKYLGTRILVSGEVVHQLDDLSTREIGTFLLAGKSKPLVLYGLLGQLEDVPEKQRRACVLFSAALRAFRKQSWEEALWNFKQSRECFGEDGPSSFYCILCETYQKNPPGSGWDGMIRMDQK